MRSLAVLISFCLYSCAPLFVYGQEDQFGIKAGLNSSVLSTSVDNIRDVKTSLNIGIYYKAHLGKKFYFRPELYYSGQGQKEELGNNSKTETALHYFNMPLLLEYGNRFSITAGPQIGLLISGTKRGTVNGQDINEDLKEKMYDGDIGVSLGLGMKVNRVLKVGTRLNRGISNINISSNPPKLHNNVLQFYVEIALASRLVKR